MPKIKQQSKIKPTKKVVIATLIGAVILAILGACVWVIIEANRQLPPKEAFAACEKRLPQSIKGDIVKPGDDFNGFFVKIQDTSKYNDWTGCVVKKLGIDQSKWNNMVSEQAGSQNPTPKELKQAYDDMVEFLSYAFSTDDDEKTIMSKLPESMLRLGDYESLSDIPSNFIQDYIYNKQFFKVYDFDGFSVLVNQRPDDYAVELVVYTEDNNRLSTTANACGTMYNISKQSSFKTPNDYTLEVSQPFFALDDSSASISNMITMFDSFSCIHTLLGVPEWSSEDAWNKLIGDNGDSTTLTKRWDNYRLNLNFKYDSGDYKFTETITEL